MDTTPSAMSPFSWISLITDNCEVVVYCQAGFVIITSYPGPGYEARLAMQGLTDDLWTVTRREVPRIIPPGTRLDEGYQSPCNFCPKAGGQSFHKATSTVFVAQDARTGSAHNMIYYGQAPPPVSLSPVYLTLRV